MVDPVIKYIWQCFLVKLSFSSHFKVFVFPFRKESIDVRVKTKNKYGNCWENTSDTSLSVSQGKCNRQLQTSKQIPT